MKRSIGNITKVKGLRLITVVTVLCETNGFSTFSKIPQVVSYAATFILQTDRNYLKKKTSVGNMYGIASCEKVDLCQLKEMNYSYIK